MSKQTINIGASPNDGTGTPLRTSFDYTNQNFTELYTALGGGVGLPGATTQVIFNDGGTNLAGDAGLVYNKTTDTLTAGNATITGSLTAYNGQTPSAIRAAASDYAAVNFDGTTASTRITSTLTGQNIGTGDFSVWARFRVPALAAFANNSAVIGLGPNAADGSGNNSCRLSFLSGGTLSFRINDAVGATTSGDIANFSTNFSGQVVDVVVTRTGSTLKIYINGTDTAYTGTPAASTSINSVYCHTGIGSNSATVFTGRIYRSVVFNRALSAGDVTELITTGVNPADQWGSQTAVYTANWSAGTDSWASGATAITGNVDAVGSPPRNDTLRAVPDTSNSVHSLSRYSLFVAGKRFLLTGSVFIPSGQTNLTKVEIQDTGSLVIVAGTSLTPNASWQSFNAEFVARGTGLQVYAMSSAGYTYTGNGTDLFYFEGFSVTRIGAIVDLDFTIGGGTTAFDRSTNGLDGTLFGGVSWTMPLEGQYINGPSTITGNLTVDTSTFFVDSSADKVGVGTTSLSGEKLTVAGNISANSWIGRANIAAPTGDCSIFRSADNTLAFGIASSTAMTLNSFGLGVGLVPINGNGKFQVFGGIGYDGQFDITAQLTNVTTSAAKGVLIGYNNTTNNGIIAAAYGNGTEGLQFWTHNNSSWGQRMTLTAAGDLSLANGNLVMATSGKGIDFSATANSSGTMTSELLNDYEEGTWTGTLKGSVSDPTIPVTATGAYTKVGRLVTVTIRYINVVTTGASGDVTITGLPFSGAENSAGSAIAFSMFTTSTTLACWNNGTTIAFYVSGAFTPATHSAGVSRSVTVTITYYV